MGLQYKALDAKVKSILALDLPKIIKHKNPRGLCSVDKLVYIMYLLLKYIAPNEKPFLPNKKTDTANNRIQFVAVCTDVADLIFLPMLHMLTNASILSSLKML